MSHPIDWAGEGFGLIIGAERLLSVREDRQRAASEANTARWTATVRLNPPARRWPPPRRRAQGSGPGGLQGGVSGAAGRSRAGATTARGGEQSPGRRTSRKEQGTARHDARSSSGAPGDRARAAVLDGAEWACVHTARVRSPHARQGAAERREACRRTRSGSHRSSGAGALLCRGVPQTAWPRSELQRGAQHAETAAIHRFGLFAQGAGLI